MEMNQCNLNYSRRRYSSNLASGVVGGQTKLSSSYGKGHMLKTRFNRKPFTVKTGIMTKAVSVGNDIDYFYLTKKQHSSVKDVKILVTGSSSDITEEESSQKSASRIPMLI